MTKLKQIYEKMRTLQTFGYDDFGEFYNNKYNLSSYFSLLTRKGLIRKIERAKFEIVDIKNLKKSSKIKNNKDLNKFLESYDIMFGLELEMEYNKSIIGYISKDGYHSSNFNEFTKYFSSESDGSLSRMTFPYSESDTTELVSIPMNKDEVIKSLEDLRDTFQKRAKRKVELHEVISFNNTTGAHLHFSLNIKKGKSKTINYKDKKIVIKGKTENTKKIIDINFLKLISKKVKSNIKKEMPEFFPIFMKSYYRKYSKRMRNIPIENQRGKYYEFNLDNDDTIEYRSLNLRGIKTWEDLIKFYKIVTTTIQECFNNEFVKEKSFNKEFISEFELELLEDKKIEEVESSIKLKKENKIKLEV